MSASSAGGSAIILKAPWLKRTHRGADERVTGGCKIAAAALWIVAVALVAVYFVERSQTDASAAGTSSSTDGGRLHDPRRRAAHDDSTTLPPTTEPPTTESTTTTTSTTEPPSLTVAAGGDVQGDRMVGKYIDAHGGAAALGQGRLLPQDGRSGLRQPGGAHLRQGHQARLEGIHLPQPDGAR